MQFTNWLGWAGRLALVGVLAGAMAMTMARGQDADEDRGPPDREPPPPPRRRGDDGDRDRPRREPRPGPDGARPRDGGSRRPGDEAEYWLGVGCVPAPDALRSQLSLPAGQGLLVNQVLPDSPASKAGIKRDDVLSTADGKPLKGSRDLVEVVQAAKEKEVKIELIRGGKPMSVAVTPGKRPDEPGGRFGEFGGRGRMPEMDRLYELFDREGNPLRFRFFHPGMLLPPGASARAPFPDDLTVKITRQGNKPAEIEVSQGDKSWKTTAEKLDELPEDVRRHVVGMLGHPFLGEKFNIRVEGPDDGRREWRGRFERPDGPPGERGRGPGHDEGPEFGRGGPPDGPGRDRPERPRGPGREDGPEFGRGGPPDGPRGERGRGPGHDEGPAFGRGGPPDGPGGNRPERPRRPGREDGPDAGRGGPPDGPPGERRRGPRFEEGRGIGRGPGPGGPGGERGDGHIERRLSQRLEEMSQRLQELRQELDEFRPNRRPKEPPPHPPEVEPGEEQP